MKLNSLSTHYCLKYTIDFVFGKVKNTRDGALPEIKNHRFPNPELVVKRVC